MKRDLRDLATAKAEKMGFSSLQEVVRVFLSRVASGEMRVELEPAVTLSVKNDRRYAKMIEDIKTGRAKTKSFSDVSSLMQYLNK